MKITKTVLASLAVLAFLAVSTRPARAGQMDCTSANPCTNFGGSIYTSSELIVSPSVANANYNVTVTEQVFENTSDGVYTYAFDVDNDSVGSGAGAITITAADTWTFTGSGAVNNYAANLRYGVVFLPPSGFALNTSSVPGTLNLTSNSQLTTSFSLPQGGEFTFFAQGGAPATGGFETGDGGPAFVAPAGTSGFSLGIESPASLPEPSVLTQLGASLLLMLAIPFVVRLRQRMA